MFNSIVILSEFLKAYPQICLIQFSVLGIATFQSSNFFNLRAHKYNMHALCHYIDPYSCASLYYYEVCGIRIN